MARKLIKRKSAVKPITGSIVDSTNIADKTVNTYSAEVIDKMNTYSSVETVIGTWADGKPLYRKVVYSAGVIGTTDINKNVCDVILVKNVNININEFIFPPGRYIDDTDRIDFFFNRDSGVFSVGLGSAWESGFKGVVVEIVYTKLTD